MCDNISCWLLLERKTQMALLDVDNKIWMLNGDDRQIVA